MNSYIIITEEKVVKRYIVDAESGAKARVAFELGLATFKNDVDVVDVEVIDVRRAE